MSTCECCQTALMNGKNQNNSGVNFKNCFIDTFFFLWKQRKQNKIHKVSNSHKKKTGYEEHIRYLHYVTFKDTRKNKTTSVTTTKKRRKDFQTVSIILHFAAKKNLNERSYTFHKYYGKLNQNPSWPVYLTWKTNLNQNHNWYSLLFFSYSLLNFCVGAHVRDFQKDKITHNPTSMDKQERLHTYSNGEIYTYWDRRRGGEKHNQRLPTHRKKGIPILHKT